MPAKVSIWLLIIQLPWLCLGQSLHIEHIENIKTAFLSEQQVAIPTSATDLYTTRKQVLALLPPKFKHASTLSAREFKELFDWIQLHLLKKFEAYTPLEALLEEGIYNCVSGSLLYALLLEHYQIPFVIYETLNHAYLIAYWGKAKRPVLIESTLKKQGWIAGKAQIARQEAHYIQQSKSSFKVSIRSTELAALQLYNLGVVAYNQKEYTKAQYYLYQTYTLYPSERVEQLYELVLAKIQNNPIEAIAQGKEE